MNLIERLKELDAKATPGPWQWVQGNEVGDWHAIVGPRHDKNWIKASDDFILTDGSACGEYSADIDVDGPDAHLIAEMRNALPKLLAVVEASKNHVDGLIKGDLDGSKDALAAIIDSLEELNQES